MVKIVHVMADGTIRDDIKGAVLPYTKETAFAYQMIADAVRKQRENSNEKK